MYLARFAFGETHFITAVLSWTPVGSLITSSRIHQLCAREAVGSCTSHNFRSDQVRVALFLSADAKAERTYVKPARLCSPRQARQRYRARKRE